MADIPEPSAKAALWRTLTRIDQSKISSKWMAFRNAMAVALPLAIGIADGNPLGAVAFTTGALNVAYSDGGDPYALRARRMLNWSVLGAVAVFVGSIAGNYHWTSIVVTALWAFVAGLCVSISSRAADLGLNTLVVLIVFGARGALSPKGALIASLLVLGGGLLQTAFALLLWPIRRYDPERRAIGEAYLDLSQELAPGSDVLLSGPLAAPSTQLQDALAALGRDHSTESERLRLLLDQADRIRMSVFVLQRLRSQTSDIENDGREKSSTVAQCIDELLTGSSKLLAAAGQCLISGESIPRDASDAQEVHRLVEHAHSLRASAPAPLGDEIASAADVLAGQLRAVVELTNHAIPQGLEDFAELEAAQPWRLQLAGWLGTLRANLDPHSAAFRHALRLAVCVGIGDTVGRSINGQRSYWIPMTIAVVLKPDFTSTLSRGVLRLCGTFGGLILATVLYHALPASPLRQLFLVGIFMFVLRWVGPANYGLFSVLISGLVVFLIAATGVPPGQVVVQRAVNTAAGGVFALIAYALWPTWERTQVREAVAEMLDASRAYFHAIVARFGTENAAVRSELDRTRRAWRRARSNAEASVDRVSSEPNITAEKVNCLNSILASSHALAHAMMALEAGLIQAPIHPAPAAFDCFANDVEFTLYYLAAALRGSPAATNTLPKLRDDYRRMIEARDAFSPADEFVVIETDRITTALNTVREQVARFIG